VRLCEMLEDRVEGLLARFMTKFDQAEALGFIETYEKLASCMLKDGEGAGCESDT
jgi:hypothetical protein